MIDMIGVGPFITIPLIVSAAGGPQAMLGWILRRALRTLRRPGVGRVGRGHAGRRRLVPLPQRNLRTANSGTAAVVPFHLAALVQRAAVDCLRLHRTVATTPRILWPGLKRTLLEHTLHAGVPVLGALELSVLVLMPGTFVAIATCAAGCCPAVPPDHGGWQARRVALGRRVLWRWSGSSSAGLTHFSAARAFDFPPGAFHLSHAFFTGMGCGHAASPPTTTGATTTFAFWAEKLRIRAAPFRGRSFFPSSRWPRFTS